jgi:hypothetical protein
LDFDFLPKQGVCQLTGTRFFAGQRFFDLEEKKKNTFFDVFVGWEDFSEKPLKFGEFFVEREKKRPGVTFCWQRPFPQQSSGWRPF